MHKMKFKSILVWLLLLNAILLSQNELSSSHTIPVFHFDIVSVANSDYPELSRLNLFTEVLYDDLLFLKEENNFVSKYEISATIWDGREQITGDIWTESIVLDNFQQTNSRRHIDVSSHSFDVEPGGYTVKLLVEDINGTVLFEGEKKTRIQDYSKKKISVSDITFARELVTDSTGTLTSIFPEVTNKFKGLGSGAKAYYEIYNPHDNFMPDTEVNYLISREKFKQNFSENIELHPGKNAMYFKLPVDSLSNGRYQITVNIKAGREKAETEKYFYIRYGGLPRTAEDLDDALQQLRYIATSQEWKKLKSAKGDAKLYEFEQFWKKKDPSAGTEYNEYMATYYARVEGANLNFSVMGRDGWRTDRGMVFIILGPPDNLIREDYPADSKPYQIWQYYSINRQFEFIDDTSFGDYKFIWPISVSELQRYAQMRNN